MQNQKDFKYWAFISYSHADKKWGEWLHKSLETYRIPRRLVGRQGREAIVPKRMFPVFIDREELSGAACLSTTIQEALQTSRYLIVICSPRSAKSEQVGREIRHYKLIGREDHVLCLIVDGEPHASSKAGCFEEECFPAAVRFRVDAHGELTGEPVEPLAADMRMVGDRRNNAQLKLISGLLGIGFDELKQRDKRRRRIRLASLATGVLCFALLLANQWNLSGQNEKLEGILTTDTLAATAQQKGASLAKGSPDEESVGTEAMLAEADRLYRQRDVPAAMKWYRLAAAEGSPQALGTLASIYHRGDSDNEPQPVKALAYLLAARQKGLESSPEEVEAYSHGLTESQLEAAQVLASNL